MRVGQSINRKQKFAVVREDKENKSANKVTWLALPVQSINSDTEEDKNAETVQGILEKPWLLKKKEI